MSRRGPLTHMQWSLWLDDAMRRQGSPQPVVYAAWDLPEHASADRIRDAVDALCQRHEALRTVFELDHQDQLCQVVRADAAPDIEYREADSDDAVASCVQRLVEDFQNAGFRLDTDVPIRVGVATRANRPRKIVLVVHHIGCDAGSMRILQTELGALLRCDATLPEPGVQPLDQAHDQDSPLGRRQADRALSYLHEQFRLIPPRLFPERPADFRSPHLRAHLPMSLDGSALVALGQRHGTAPNIVIAAAYNAVLSLHTGHARCPIILTSSNRYTPKVKASVGAFFGTVLMSCDLSGDPPFSEVIGRVRDAYLPALRHSRYPVDTMKELRARESFRRGVAMRIGINFGTYSDERYQSEKLAKASRPAGEVIFGQEPPNPGIELGLTAGFDATSCLLTLTAAAHILTESQARDLLLAMQTVLTAACESADPRLSDLRRTTGLSGPDRGASWVELDNTWVNLAHTESVLNQHPAVDRAVVFGPADWPSDNELVACVATHQPDLTPYALRRFMVLSSQTGVGIMAPHRYVIRSEVPDQLREPSAWQAPGQLAHGDGLTAPTRPAQSTEESALCQAIARTHDLPLVSPDASYLVLGGRLRQLPAVIAELERLGYHAPPYDHFTGWHTVAELVPLLHATPAAERTTSIGS